MDKRNKGPKAARGLWTGGGRKRGGKLGFFQRGGNGFMCDKLELGVMG